MRVLSITHSPAIFPPVTGRVDGIEIWPTGRHKSGQSYPRHDGRKPAFWSVFAHVSGRGLECLADCKTAADAETVRVACQRLLNLQKGLE